MLAVLRRRSGVAEQEKTAVSIDTQSTMFYFCSCCKCGGRTMGAALHSQPQYQGNPYGGPSSSELLPTEKQIRYARRIAQAGGLVLPWEAQASRRSLSFWIDANADVLNTSNAFGDYASSKQVAFRRTHCSDQTSRNSTCVHQKSPADVTLDRQQQIR